jgi:probable F420-dependent oxidoreductase
MSRPFRFSVTPPAVAHPISDWQAELTRIEDLGVDVIVLADHFTEGWDTEPMIGLTAAAMSTTRLGLQTGVLSNDYRHPVLVHRMAALLDVVSGGRLILGLGAGWLKSDYEAAGIVLDPPGRRIDRLEESLAVIKGLFRPEPFTFEGAHYTIHGLQGAPSTVSEPRPPILLGGGGPRMLRLAGREADIVGINAVQKEGALGRPSIVDLLRESVEKKVGWVHEGIRQSGREPSEVELEMNLWLARVTANESEADDYLTKIAQRYEVEPAELRDSPSVLVGTVEQCVDMLEERRASLGISYFQFDAGYPQRTLEPFAPIIQRLSGK